MTPTLHTDTALAAGLKELFAQQQDAIDVDLGLNLVNFKVLSPIDLAVSKLAHYADNDQQDIQQLVRLGLISGDEIEQRATRALSAFIGGQRMVRLNIDNAVNRGIRH